MTRARQRGLIANVSTLQLHPHIAYLGLGSNLGDRRAFLVGARDHLAACPDIEIEAASSLYQSASCGGSAGQGDYLNAVLRVRTHLTPQALLHCCRVVEEAFGRVRTERWGARTLDIDLLFFDQLVLNDEQLIIPHPRLQERAFVLLPLCDLAPELVHPTLGKTLRQLAQQSGLSPAQRCAQTW